MLKKLLLAIGIATASVSVMPMTGAAGVDQPEVATVAGVVTAESITTTKPAFHAPRPEVLSGCTKGMGTAGGWARCTGGTGVYRVEISCVDYDGYHWKVYGSIKSPPSYSAAVCGDKYGNGGVYSWKAVILKWE